APRSYFRLQVPQPSGAEVQVASVRITPSNGSASPSAVGILAFKPAAVTVTQAGVPAMTAGTGFRMFAEKLSGVAIANAGNSAATVTLELYGADGTSTGMSGFMSISAN